MDITTRDVLTVLGLIFMGTGVYVAIVQRVTRMEALQHRVETLEDRTDALEERGGRSGEALARMAAQLEAQGLRILALEGAVRDGIGEVLEELRARRPNA